MSGSTSRRVSSRVCSRDAHTDLDGVSPPHQLSAAVLQVGQGGHGVTE